MNNTSTKSPLGRSWSNLSNQLALKFFDVLNWSFAQKTLLIAVPALIYHTAAYYLWLIPYSADAAPYDFRLWIDYQLAWNGFLLASIIVAITAFRSGSELEWPFIVFVSFYHAWVVAAMYGFGTFTTYISGHLTCVLVVTLITFGTKTFVFSAVTCIAVFSLTQFGQFMDLLPHAPFLGNVGLDITSQPAFVRAAALTLFFINFQVVSLTLLVLAALHHSEARWVNALGLIKRYLPDAVADNIITGKGTTIDAPRRRRVTVMFADIVGFTDVADRVEPETTTQVLNEYLSAMVEVVEENQGTVNEFAGDGFMALFGAPKDLEPVNQARSAVSAALAINNTLADLNYQWRKLGLGQDLQIRIGINTGVLSVGSFGSQGRMTYTAIGLQTNVTARIQGHCKPGEILLSEATWQLVSEEIHCSQQESINVKGLHFPLTVYRVDQQRFIKKPDRNLRII